MNLADINWDFKEAGNWPFGIKVVSIIIMCVILIAAWIYYDTLDQLSDLERAEKQEIVLKKNIRAKTSEGSKLRGL